jgi:hypothetical protein
MPNSVDTPILVNVIRRIFAESPVFSDALISAPQAGPEGEVIVEIGFGRDAPLLRVNAPTVQEAYTVLHELASAMVDIERDCRDENGSKVRRMAR